MFYDCIAMARRKTKNSLIKTCLRVYHIFRYFQPVVANQYNINRFMQFKQRAEYTSQTGSPIRLYTRYYRIYGVEYNNAILNGIFKGTVNLLLHVSSWQNLILCILGDFSVIGCFFYNLSHALSTLLSFG